MFESPDGRSSYAESAMSERPLGVRVRTLAKAAEIVGGRESLRYRLKVSTVLLAVWFSGAEPPPTDVFLKAVDIVEDARIQSIKHGRA
jgi:hypothetical protein